MLSIKRPFDAPESTSKKLAVSPKNSPDVASIYTSIINFTRQHSTIESTKNPHAHLDIPKPTSLLTDLIKKSHLSNSSPNEYKALELCDLLLNTEPSNLIDKFYKWMNSFCRDASAEITAFESKYPRDPWAKVIIALSSGDTVKASKMAQSRGDQHLAVLLVGPEDYDVRQDSKDKIKELEQDGRFEKMSVCHQKVWYIMSGKLGYCNQHIVVVEHLEWERVLGLYVWSGVRAHQSLEHAVQLYNEALAGMPGTHYLISNKKTASPPSSCLWVSVLRLWASKMPMAVMTKERARRRSADKNILSMNDWPAGLVWILTLVVPDWFSEEKVYQFTERWCNTLQDNLLSDQAVCAALYLKSPSNREKLARSILNKCKWNDKHYLVNELCIPMLWIQEAKAIYAHSVKDYATEADWYFEANEFEKAKYAILNNLVPTTLLCEYDDLGIQYLSKLDRLEKDMDGHVILDTYQALEKLPQRITDAIGDPEATKLVREDILRMIDSLKRLQDRYNAPKLAVFIKRLCGKLVRQSTRFDNAFFETLSTQKESSFDINEFSDNFITSFVSQVHMQQNI